jgi:hypothetical protein
VNKCFVVLGRLNNIKNSILNLSNFKFNNVIYANSNVASSNSSKISNFLNKDDFAVKNQINNYSIISKPQKKNQSNNLSYSNKSDDLRGNKYQNTYTFEKTCNKEFNQSDQTNNDNENSHYKNPINANYYFFLN